MHETDTRNENLWENRTSRFEPLAAGFAQGGVLDDVAPGPLLAAAVGAAAEDGLSKVSENELLGLMRAARKAGAWLAWAQTMAEAEYASRNLAWDPRQEKEVVDEIAVQEVAQEIPLSGGAARDRLARSHAARERLGRCLALLGAGQIDDFGMRIIAESTAGVDDALVGRADRLIAAKAAGLTPGSLRRLCTRVVMTVDAAVLEERRRRAARTRWVEIGPEYSGNASVAAREIPVTSALAMRQTLTRWARKMRKAGAAGTLDNLRADALTALVLERNPLAAAITAVQDQGSWGDLQPADQDPRDAAEDPDAASYDPWAFPDGNDGDAPEDGTGGTGGDGGSGGSGGSNRTGPGGSGNGNGAAAGTGSPAALINILVSEATLDGTSATPAQIAGFGYVDGPAARQMVADASQNPATRFCVTVVGADGTAVAHGCARGRHPWIPPQPGGGGGNRDGPPATGPPATGIGAFLASLNIRLEPVASQAGCDHNHREHQHDPSRTLSHLIWARNATCATPGCGAAAVTADLDHTRPYEMGGETCECNLGPRCKR